MNRHRVSQWGRAIRLVTVVLVATVLGTLIWIIDTAWQYAYGFTHAGCLGTRANLETQGYPSESITFDTPRNYQLKGWLTNGSRFPDTVIIVLPGGSSNSEFALPDAALMAKAGYGTLVYEHRSCANPAQLHSGGYLEADDLLSAAHYLHTRPAIRHIGVLGFSAGGTAALLAAAQDEEIEAVVAIGGLADLESATLQASTLSNPIEWAVRRFILIFLGWQLGIDPYTVRPVDRIAQISPRPILLIYGEYEAQPGDALYAKARDPKALWIVSGAGHGDYRTRALADYETHLVHFFQDAFQPVR